MKVELCFDVMLVIKLLSLLWKIWFSVFVVVGLCNGLVICCFWLCIVDVMKNLYVIFFGGVVFW